MVQPCRPAAAKPAAAAPGGKAPGGKKGGGALEADGEYKLPLALGLGKLLKQPGLTPDAIAAAITAKLPPAAPGESPIARTSVTAGFINVSVDRLWASRALAAWHTAGVPRAGQKRQRVLVDFSSPNIAKDMHVGHLRSTIIGDSIARCLEFQGHDVLRVNHVGDWGTQFGMLIASLAESLSLPDPADATADGSDIDISALPPISDLVGVYREAKRRYDADPAFNEWAGRCVVALQAGGPRAVRVWTHICDASRAEFSATYSRLGARLEEVGESFYGKFIPAVVAELDAKGLTLESNGAKLMLPSVAKPATALEKKDVERLLFSYLLRPPPATIRSIPEAAAALAPVDALAAAAAGGDAAAKGKEPEVLDKAAKALSAKVTPALVVAALREVGGQVAATVLRDGGEAGLKVRVPIYSVPLMVVKTSGGYTYDTTDLAAAWYRTHPVGADRVVVVTDNGQETHFQLIAAAAAEAGWLTPQRDGRAAEVSYEHVGFGLVLGADGKKIRTRAGETVKLRDLLDEAVAAARVEAEARNAPPAAGAAAAKEEEKDDAADVVAADEPAGEAAGPVVKRVERVPFTDAELAANAEAIGVAAVKYFDLRQHRSTPYAFDAARMVALNGDTAARLLYAYVRIKSIGTAAGRVESDAVTYEDVIAQGVPVAVDDDAEWQLALHLLWLPSVLAAAAADLHINRICEYLSQLVDRFSSFYSRVRVLSAPPEAKRQRLMLCATTALALEAGLSMLGIRTVQRM